MNKSKKRDRRLSKNIHNKSKRKTKKRKNNKKNMKRKNNKKTMKRQNNKKTMKRQNKKKNFRIRSGSIVNLDKFNKMISSAGSEISGRIGYKNNSEITYDDIKNSISLILDGVRASEDIMGIMDSKCRSIYDKILLNFIHLHLEDLNKLGKKEISHLMATMNNEDVKELAGKRIREALNELKDINKDCYNKFILNRTKAPLDFVKNEMV
jgi:hypothetical protein